MKNIFIWMVVSTIGISIILLLSIWKGMPLWLDETNPLTTMTSLMLLSMIVIISSASILFYMFLYQNKLSENTEKENQKKFKLTLDKQKKLQVIQIRQVVHYLISTFKLMTQN